MEDLFARIVLGHLVGDYLLQTKAMALNKSVKGWKGAGWCTWHCLVYTLSVCLFLWNFHPWLMALVFLSHWPLDRWSWGAKWLDMIRGRNFVKAWQSSDQYREIDIAFSCLVYAVVDNTMHLLALWGISKLL